MLSPYARLKPGESYTWHYDWYACRVDGSCPVLDCTSAGVTCERLAATRAGDKLRLKGRFGVFATGRAKADFYGRNRHLGTVDLGAVTPVKPLLLSSDVPAPAAADTVSLDVNPDGGGIPVQLARAAIAP